MKNKISKFVSKANNVLFGEAFSIEENILDYIGSDYKADICVMQYEYNDKEINEVSEFLANICNEYNDILATESMDTIRCYYILNPGVAELHIKEVTPISLDEETEKLIYETVDPADAIYLKLFNEMDSIYSKFKGFDIESIEDQITNISEYSNFTVEHYNLALETLKYLGIDKDVINVFAEKFNDYQFNKTIEEGSINESYKILARQEKKIIEAADDWNAIEDVPIDITLEAYDLLQAILDEAGPSIHKPAVGPKAATGSWADDWDDEDDDEEDNGPEEENDSSEKVATGASGNTKEEDKKEDKSSENNEDDDVDLSDLEKSKPDSRKKGRMLNLNSIKLGLKGLATKMKDMSTKQKEMSRNLDNAIRAYVKAYKDTLQKERREDIIKGRLIPSFSRCLKAGVGLAVLGIATGGVIIPIIAGIAGLALNKKATEKERYLLLDELETELEVIEKELAYAEENREMKKYRALLQYKKELQRQYQRIRYNIKLDKKYIPKASSGTNPHNTED